MSDVWREAVGPSSDLSVLAIVLRGLIAYLVLLTLIRATGFRAVGELTAFDFIVSITVGSIIANALTDGRSSLGAPILAAGVWIITHFVLAKIAQKLPAVRAAVVGQPKILIDRGKILETNLADSQISTDRLTELLREKNAAKLADVEFAMLEPDGQLSVIKKADLQPVTPQHLGIKVPPSSLPRIVVADGKVKKGQLSALRLSEAWLMKELHKRGVKRLKDVVLAQADEQGSLCLDLKNDTAQIPQPTDNQSLLASLKKCAADLASFSLETENTESQKLYRRNQSRLEKAAGLVEAYLKNN